MRSLFKASRCFRFVLAAGMATLASVVIALADTGQLNMITEGGKPAGRCTQGTDCTCGSYRVIENSAQHPRWGESNFKTLDAAQRGMAHSRRMGDPANSRSIFYDPDYAEPLGPYCVISDDPADATAAKMGIHSITDAYRVFRNLRERYEQLDTLAGFAQDIMNRRTTHVVDYTRENFMKGNAREYIDNLNEAKRQLDGLQKALGSTTKLTSDLTHAIGTFSDELDTLAQRRNALTSSSSSGGAQPLPQATHTPCPPGQACGLETVPPILFFGPASTSAKTSYGSTTYRPPARTPAWTPAQSAYAKPQSAPPAAPLQFGPSSGAAATTSGGSRYHPPARPTTWTPSQSVFATARPAAPQPPAYVAPRPPKTASGTVRSSPYRAPVASPARVQSTGVPNHPAQRVPRPIYRPSVAHPAAGYAPARGTPQRPAYTPPRQASIPVRAPVRPASVPPRPRPVYVAPPPRPVYVAPPPRPVYVAPPPRPVYVPPPTAQPVYVPPPPPPPVYVPPPRPVYVPPPPPRGRH
jgi:hypothetical protein